MPRRLASPVFDFSTLEPPPPTSRPPIATRIVSAEKGRCSSMQCRYGRRRCVEGVREMRRALWLIGIQPRVRPWTHIPCPPMMTCTHVIKVRCEGVDLHAHAPSAARHGLSARASAGRWFKCPRSLHALGRSPARRARTEVLCPLRAAALPLGPRAQAQRSRTALSRCCHTSTPTPRLDAHSSPACSSAPRPTPSWVPASAASSSIGEVH